MSHPIVIALLLATAPPPTRGDAVADSLRADEIVRETVLRHAADVRGCYEREGLRRDPALAGTIEVALTILPTGRVDAVAVAADAMRGAPSGTGEVARCVAAVARNWRFDRGPYAVETVAFPFRLVPQSAAASARARPHARS